MCSENVFSSTNFCDFSIILWTLTKVFFFSWAFTTNVSFCDIIYSFCIPMMSLMQAYHILQWRQLSSTIYISSFIAERYALCRSQYNGWLLATHQTIMTFVRSFSFLWSFPNDPSDLLSYYGIMGCRVSKGGIQNYIHFN